MAARVVRFRQGFGGYRFSLYKLNGSLCWKKSEFIFVKILIQICNLSHRFPSVAEFKTEKFSIYLYYALILNSFKKERKIFYFDILLTAELRKRFLVPNSIS